jgi:mRNA interferase HigB
MRIISKRTLREFYEQPQYRDSEERLQAWYYEAKHAEWRTPADVKRQYRSASFVGDGRVVFNICGNKYRLIVRFNYEAGLGYIRFVGTHKQYDQIDAETI